MVREFIIGLYLLFFRIQFNLSKMWPLKEKVTFVISFRQNGIFVYEELKRQYAPFEVVFLCDNSCFEDVKSTVNEKVLPFQTKNVFKLMRSIYHIATSKYVIVDNYFGFLAAVKFKDRVQCIQLWHAVGAIKTFGLKDKSIIGRSELAHKRFLKVYEKFNKVIVGSDVMANIFMEAFSLSIKNILPLGIPRTDLFYDKHYQQKVKKRILDDNEILKCKKVILYAPTFRDDSLNQFDLKLDLDLMYETLKDQYVLIIKLHPAIKKSIDFEQEYDGFVLDYSNYKDINELLLITDYLISDYSSIPFEFAILGKPMIFYPYDLEDYRSNKGLWDDYDKIVPGPIVFNTEEIVKLIKDDHFDINRVLQFSNEWNKYSKGNSSKNLVDFLRIN
jgi:teichoic acid glycerol-phosphate primase